MHIRIIKNSRASFRQIFAALDFTAAEMKKPLIFSSNDNALGLINPYSKVTCLILYLYSMELGTPQLYAEVNRVARDMDFTQLKELGPFIRALGEIT